MKSYNIFAEEVDNLNVTIEVIKAQLEKIQLMSHSIGIIYYPSDFEYKEFIVKMKELLDIPYVGASAIAMMSSGIGYSTAGLSIAIWTADDVEFHAGITNKLDTTNYKDEISNLCNKLEDRAAGQEKLIFILGSKFPNVPGDFIISEIENVSKNVPIYGAFASDDFDFQEQSVACDYEQEIYRLTLVYITGNIKPKFINEQSIYTKADFAYEVTKANGDFIYQVGDTTFVEALKKAGFEHEKSGVIMDYIISPFIVSITTDDGNKISVSRNLTHLYPENGSASFLGGIPEGSAIEIGLINGNYIQESVEKVYSRIVKMLEDNDDGYKYETCVCTSCAARYLVLVANPEIEAKAYETIIGNKLNMTGIYSFGEFAPVGANSSGNSGDSKLFNVFHNATFTMLIL